MPTLLLVQSPRDLSALRQRVILLKLTPPMVLCAKRISWLLGHSTGQSSI